MDSTLPENSQTSTKQDSDYWRGTSTIFEEESSSSSDESYSEQPPSLEPLTETSYDLEEVLHAKLHKLNDHQKAKFSKLRRRVWELEEELSSAIWRELGVIVVYMLHSFIKLIFS